jgi:hypothetical protein
LGYQEIGYHFQQNELTFLHFRATRQILGKSLRQLLDFQGDVGQVFSQYFTIDLKAVSGTMQFDLVENGNQVLVTNENRRSIIESP